MKVFFDMFGESYREMTGKSSLKCITVTGLLCAVSMAIEGFTIPLPFAKINFAFIAIAAIGMLYGPSVSFFAGGICDILGYLIRPSGAFLPVYTAIAMLQGLIYGITLYRKNFLYMGTDEHTKGIRYTEFGLRMVIARLLDVVIINLLLNTYFNMYYGFIPREAFGAAVGARSLKNFAELLADIPLMFAFLPAVLTAFVRTFGKNEKQNTV